MKGAKMVDFSKLLSPEQRERIAAVQQEVERLYGLSDRWLGEALLKLARETRAEFPDLAVNPHGLSYDANFVWHVVPEVAKRLGARNLQPNEGISQNIASMNNDALRCTVGRSEEHTSELQSLMSNSYDVFCLKKKKIK